MKILKFLCAFISVFYFTSCATTTSFYQVYNVKPAQETITKSNNLIFEDSNCIITYNLWADGGNIGFDFYNKTDEKIDVNLNESNFILNGFAYDYYKHRTFTTSESISASISNFSTAAVAVTGVNSNRNVQTNRVQSSGSTSMNSFMGYSVSVSEDSIICIPGKTTKRISEYSIYNKLVRNCDLYRYPGKKEINTKTYTEEKSPIVFSNLITYKSKGKGTKVENKFYVSEITNYPSFEFFEYKYVEQCGQRGYSTTKYYKFYDTDKFYIKYDKGQSTWKH